MDGGPHGTGAGDMSFWVFLQSIGLTSLTCLLFNLIMFAFQWTVGFHNSAFSHAAFWLFVAAQAFTATLLFDPSMTKRAADADLPKAAPVVPRYLRVDEVDSGITKESLVFSWWLLLLSRCQFDWWLLCGWKLTARLLNGLVRLFFSESLRSVDLQPRQIVNSKSPERIIRSPDKIATASRLTRLRFIWARALDSVISRWLQVWKIQDVLRFLDGFDGSEHPSIFPCFVELPWNKTAPHLFWSVHWVEQEGEHPGGYPATSKTAEQVDEECLVLKLLNCASHWSCSGSLLSWRR